MARNFAESTIKGQLVDNPEISKSSSGKIRVEFTVASNRYNDKEKESEAKKAGKQTVDYIRHVSFGDEALKYSFLRKGDKVCVSGSLQMNNAVDRKTGNTVVYPEVVVRFEGLTIPLETLTKILEREANISSPKTYSDVDYERGKPDNISFSMPVEDDEDDEDDW